MYFSIADCLPSGVKLKTLRKDGMKSKGLTFGVRDKIGMPSAWGLAKIALSGAIKSGIASLHANLQLSATVKSNPKKTPAAIQKTVGLNCWVRGANFGKWV